MNEGGKDDWGAHGDENEEQNVQIEDKNNK